MAELLHKHKEDIVNWVYRWLGGLSGMLWSVDLSWSRSIGYGHTVVEPDLTTVSDQELVELCVKAGNKDERPFREVFRRHRQMVWNVCYGFVRNPEDAEDLTQDVFFKAYRGLPNFEGRSSMKTWLHRIALNVGQNELRRRSRRPQDSETSIDLLGEYLSVSESPESQVMHKAQQEMLRQAIDSLKPEASEVIYLKDIQQLPYGDIADQLGISLSAAKMRVQRARLALVNAYRELSTVS